MAVQIKCETVKGGAVVLNKERGVWASYAVATAGDLPPAELLYVGATLTDGRAIQVFLNNENGLLVVDVINKNGKGGIEILRRTL